MYTYAHSLSVSQSLPALQWEQSPTIVSRAPFWTEVCVCYRTVALALLLMAIHHGAKALRTSRLYVYDIQYGPQTGLV